MLGLTVIGFSTGLSVKGVTAHALQNEWRTAHWVTLTKNVTVKKIHVVTPMYKSRSVKSYTAKRGEHYKMEHWGTDYSWVLQSGKFNSGGKYLYVVAASYKGGWFKMGIHKIAKSQKKSYSNYPLHTGNYSIAKYSGFNTTDYLPGFIDPDYGSQTFVDKKFENDVFTVKSPATRLMVKKAYDDYTHQDVLLVQLNGKEGYDMTTYDVLPYNSYKVSSDIVNSPYSPFSGKAVVQHGMQSSNIKYWFVDRGSNPGAEYVKVHGRWQYHGQS